jgi:hypothetical protein
MDLDRIVTTLLVIPLMPCVSDPLILKSSYFFDMLSTIAVNILCGWMIGYPLYMISLENISLSIISMIND